MLRLRQFAASIYGLYAWVVFALIFLIVAILAILLRRPPLGRRIARIGARLLLRLTSLTLSVAGLDRLPAQPHVLVVNHSSFIDGIVLAALLPASPGYAFVMRQEFDSQRYLCPFMRSLGALVLTRSRKKKRVRSNVDSLTRALIQGSNLIIFPEGGFSPEPGLKPFHSGAFIAAANANVPIVVAGLRGARNALKPKTWLPRRVAIALEIGPTIRASGTDRAAIMQSLAAARAAMMPLLKDAESAPGSG